MQEKAEWIVQEAWGESILGQITRTKESGGCQCELTFDALSLRMCMYELWSFVISVFFVDLEFFFHTCTDEREFAE